MSDLREIYTSLKSEIDAIDEKLDSLGDAKAAGKRAITNQLIEKQRDSWTPVVETYVNTLTEAPQDVRIGVFYGIVRGLTSKLQELINKDLEELIKDIPDNTPEITPEQAKELSEIRSKLYAQIKSVIGIAEQFGDNEGMEMPKKRTGSRGKRGKRALSFFTWYIGEKKFDKLAEVVEIYPQYDKVADLTKAMREAKLNLTNPEGDLQFTLPDGEVLVGVNGLNENTSSDDEDDEDDNDETED